MISEGTRRSNYAENSAFKEISYILKYMNIETFILNCTNISRCYLDQINEQNRLLSKTLEKISYQPQIAVYILCITHTVCLVTLYNTDALICINSYLTNAQVIMS